MAYRLTQAGSFSYLFLISFILIMANPAWAATYIVESSADTAGAPTSCGSGDGCTLRQVINKVNAGSGGDTITFAASTNGKPIIMTKANGGTYQVVKPVTIQGNGEIDTIIDGGGIGQVFYVDTTSGAFENLTIQNGNGGTGGAILVNGGDLTLTGTTLTGNNATDSSGAFQVSGNVTMTDSTVTNNTAVKYYGCCYIGGSLTMTNSSVSNNKVPNGYCGGFAAQGNLTMKGSRINFNSSKSNATFVVDGSVNISDSLIAGNMATADSSGIYQRYSGQSLTLTNSVVYGNSATKYAGVTLNTNGSATITNSIIANNNGGDCSNPGGGTWTSGGGNIDSDGTCLALSKGPGDKTIGCPPAH